MARHRCMYVKSMSLFANQIAEGSSLQQFAIKAGKQQSSRQHQVNTFRVKQHQTADDKNNE